MGYSANPCVVVQPPLNIPHQNEQDALRYLDQYPEKHGIRVRIYLGDVRDFLKELAEHLDSRKFLLFCQRFLLLLVTLFRHLTDLIERWHN